MTGQTPAPTQAPASPGLAAAHEFDRVGRHAEALETLRSYSGRGDAGAMSELAHRLLVGDRAPKLPRHALSILLEAVKLSEPRSLARMAALAAGGAYVKQDWEAALKMLAQAAAAGDAGARGQLQCLQPEGSLPAGWMEMAARVPMKQWLQPATQVQLHENVRRMPQIGGARRVPVAHRAGNGAIAACVRLRLDQSRKHRS